MEGMPAVLIEAGMLGVPCVAYDVAGVSEVVVDGQTGRLVAWGDEQALSDSLADLLCDPSAAKAMGEAARRRCDEMFSIDRVAPRYLELYRQILLD